MLQNLPPQVLQSSMSRRSAEIEMDTIQHVALSGDQQPGVRCWPVAAVAEWVSFETIGGACKIKGHGVSKIQSRNGAKNGFVASLGLLSIPLHNCVSELLGRFRPQQR
jgi:hypothetical protein